MKKVALCGISPLSLEVFKLPLESQLRGLIVLGRRLDRKSLRSALSPILCKSL